MKRVRIAQSNQFTTPVVVDEPQRNWLVPAAVVGVFCLFFLAVFAAGVSIRASYTLAHLQERREIALQQQQVLQERLAEVTSLSYTQAYAADAGFTVDAAPVASLNLTTPVAQR
ncbi:hypothetical protein LRY65_04685 [Candidatus Woesebacteria bacterium]|nr:hypothetical protein [Candidatus Woesebacteria bacterium]MCD8506914.1 hypothetical protein [Candidatus Woesebacteria bacterium]MCD8527468.1 hypothetical protein [Candidatus Woesebacteria bacterium]MCD8546210.1 hypothetical protein [Candidatus Woesebacteria bacterium]